jgi:tRNA (adenine37-N6)-methyltransferase
MTLKQIGVIRTPHQQAAGTPIQSSQAHGVVGTVLVFDEYRKGLKDLEGFERIWLIYWFDRATEAQLIVKPYLDEKEHGVFATRAPARPNAIGISAVTLLKVDANVLTIGGADMLDGTPLLDIKPYVPSFDRFEVQRCGWLEKPSRSGVVADGRFEKKP